MPTPKGHQFEFPSPGEAIGALIAQARAVGCENVDLSCAAGRVLASAIVADRPSPPVDVSAMDGFAMRRADAGRGTLAIAGEVRIGQEPPPLPAGACLRIVTGGAVPAGADAVVKREDVEEFGGTITIPREVASRLEHGTHIRRSGENLPRGGTVVPSGTVVTPAIVGALAAFGVVSPTVYRLLRVGILTTGDELVPAAAQPTAWQLRDSNGPALAALVRQLAFVGAVRVEHAEDDAGTLRARVRELLNSCDVLLLTGGVSMGHRDFVTDVLASCGVRTIFHGVPQRPGRPALGGVTKDGVPVIGLPGNPVSVLVTARRMVYPILAARAGAARAADGPHVVLANADGKVIPLWWQRLVRVVEPGRAELVDTRGSGDLVSAARSDGFVEIPPNTPAAGPWPYFSWAT